MFLKRHLLPARQQKVSSVVDEILTYPQPPQKKSAKAKSTSQTPKHLSSEQFVTYLEEKQQQKQKEEEEKQL